MSRRAGLAYDYIRRAIEADAVPTLVDLRCQRRRCLLARVYETTSGPLLAATSGRRPVPLPPTAELIDEQTGNFRHDVGPAGPILLDEPVEEDGLRGYGAAPGEVSFACRCAAPKIDRARVVRAARQAPPTVTLLVRNPTMSSASCGSARNCFRPPAASRSESTTTTRPLTAACSLNERPQTKDSKHHLIPVERLDRWRGAWSSIGRAGVTV